MPLADSERSPACANITLRKAVETAISFPLGGRLRLHVWLGFAQTKQAEPKDKGGVCQETNQVEDSPIDNDFFITALSGIMSNPSLCAGYVEAEPRAGGRAVAA